MKKPIFTGACTALVTPFLNGSVNYPMLERLIRRQTDAEIPAVVLCGTTGESPTLSDCEKLEIFRKGKQYAAGKCLILAGTGSNSTEPPTRSITAPSPAVCTTTRCWPNRYASKIRSA